ncbi:DUF4167 domain-containing protein [Indioceanicola profundi]|uniref:DUF4167 domain-containing protein n=1 Tax=Indioceanicola profundi TaxID=2220096 RepID=UPI000E6AA694
MLATISEKPHTRFQRPGFKQAHPSSSGGTPTQRRDIWVARAREADMAGDRVHAETCWQHAEHWHRVYLGQE